MSTEPESQQMDVYGGVRWSAIAAWGQQAIQFGIGIVLARLLMPRDYGLLAMATVFIGFIGIFKTMGFHTAIIQRRQISDALLSSLYYFILAVAGLLTVVAVAAAPIAAWIYREPRVMPVMAVLGIGFLLSAPGLMPFAVLSRQMRFGRLAVVELTSVVIGGGVAIALAVAGSGVWALAIGSLAGTAACTLLYQALSQWRPRLIFRWAEIRTVFSFGANLTGFGIFNYFARNADKFIIGAFLGLIPLGYYSLAYGILLKPRDAVTSVLMRVLFPAFSRMQDDDERLKAAYLRACGAIAFVTFPMMLGLAVMAHPFVEVVLGEKWLPAVPLIWLLAPLGMIQSVSGTAGQIYLAKGRADYYFRLGVLDGALHVIGFLVGVGWGVFGVAVAYCITSAISIPIYFGFAARLVGLRWQELLKAFAPIASSASTMALVVWVGHHALENMNLPDGLALLASIVLGVVLYGTIVLYTRPPALQDLARLMPEPWLRIAHYVGLNLVDHTSHV